jgi:hypothetical protein
VHDVNDQRSTIITFADQVVANPQCGRVEILGIRRWQTLLGLRYWALASAQIDGTENGVSSVAGRTYCGQFASPVIVCSSVLTETLTQSGFTPLLCQHRFQNLL